MDAFWLKDLGVYSQRESVKYDWTTTIPRGQAQVYAYHCRVGDVPKDEDTEGRGTDLHSIIRIQQGALAATLVNFPSVDDLQTRPAKSIRKCSWGRQTSKVTPLHIFSTVDHMPSQCITRGTEVPVATD